MNWKTGGFTEAGVSVRDIDAWVDFLCGTGGWEVRHRGMCDEGWKQLWPVDVDIPVDECLVGRPGDDTGLVRLFRFDMDGQEEIRRGTAAWDPGGIYDLDVRVGSMERMHPALRSLGWRGASDAPVNWTFGPLEVLEWIATGPESVVLALIERIEPPLEEDLPADGFSRVFNSSQIVSDIDRAIGFYKHLGFQKILHHSGPMGGGGGAVLGLSPEEADTVVDLVIMHPDGVVEGSVELVKVHGKPGRDVGEAALPRHLGLNLLRFPVEGMDAFEAHLAQADNTLQTAGAGEALMAPYGRVRVVALRSPDGAWLEFYEPL